MLYKNLPVKRIVSMSSATFLKMLQYTECQALHGNKIKYYVSSTIKCIREINYIFKHWISQSFLCAQWISIWAPLLAWHTSRWY